MTGLKDSKGFGVVEACLVLLVIATLAFSSWFVWHTKRISDKAVMTSNTTTLTNAKKDPAKTDGTLTQVSASYADNTKSISLSVGQKLTVSLDSTYWRFAAPSDTDVLAVSGDPTQTACKQQTVPGSGCGVLTQVYVAKKAGQSTISASRTSCGEALGCTAEQANYELTVIVK